MKSETPKPSNDSAGRSCPRCKYTLDAILTDVCPECGQQFDRSDPTSYLSNEDLDRDEGVWVIVGWIGALYPVAIAVLCFMEYYGMSLALEHLPRSHIDSATSVPWVQCIEVVRTLGCITLPLAALMVLAGLCFTIRGKEPSKSLARLLIAVLLWGAVFLLFTKTPSLSNWFMD